MNCREVTEFLADYLMGDLPAATLSLFQAHIAGCPDCRNYLDSYRGTIALSRSAMNAIDLPPMPEELVRAVLAAQERCR
jgi:anti-sigma factor RsiW